MPRKLRLPAQRRSIDGGYARCTPLAFDAGTDTGTDTGTRLAGTRPPVLRPSLTEVMQMPAYLDTKLRAQHPMSVIQGKSSCKTLPYWSARTRR